MDDFASDTDSDYTSYWRDWVRDILLPSIAVSRAVILIVILTFTFLCIKCCILSDVTKRLPSECVVDDGMESPPVVSTAHDGDGDASESPHHPPQLLPMIVTALTLS